MECSLCFHEPIVAAQIVSYRVPPLVVLGVPRIFGFQHSVDFGKTESFERGTENRHPRYQGV